MLYDISIWINHLLIHRCRLRICFWQRRLLFWLHSVFLHKFFNLVTDGKILYTKQRNWCASLLRKEKKKYFANLNKMDIIDNKKFWQTVKPFLSEKLKPREKIILVKKEDLVSSEYDVAQRFFQILLKILIYPNMWYAANMLHLIFKNNPTLMAILKYRDHPSIPPIKRFLYQTVPFHFCLSGNRFAS